MATDGVNITKKKLFKLYFTWKKIKRKNTIKICTNGKKPIHNASSKSVFEDQ